MRVLVKTNKRTVWVNAEDTASAMMALTTDDLDEFAVSAVTSDKVPDLYVVGG